MFKQYIYNLNKLIIAENESYILVKNKFSRTRKMSFKDFVFYILGNKGKTTVLEIDDYYENRFRDVKMPISKQGLSNQRQYLDPSIFKDANKNATKSIYSDEIDLKKFKGHNVFAVDGSQIDLPNTPITRDEFEVDLRSLKETNIPKARISVLSDVKNDFIIDSTIKPLKTDEITLAYENIENSSKTVDLSKSIIIFDRYYASTELYLQLIEKNSKFIFRLKKNYYKKERNHMQTNDEYVTINLNKTKTNKIKNKELIKKAKEIKQLKLRIVNIPLKTGEIESLITNIPHELATPTELKELYGERWQIEESYNVLKNKIQIENFSGKKRIIIEQDFYSQIMMYNILINIERECNWKLKKEKRFKNQECKYKINRNLLAGKLKHNLIKAVFTENNKEREKIYEQIYQTAQRYLIKEKPKPPTPRKNTTQHKRYPYNNRKSF